jgi:hypothetical protein
MKFWIVVFITSLLIWSCEQPIHKIGPNGEITSRADFISTVSQNTVEEFSSPDGLRILDSFDPNKPTIIFVHGWVRDKNNMSMFVNASGWQGAGFNTMIYRWHHDGYEVKDCSYSGIIYECAEEAQLNIYGNGAHAGEEFVNDYKAHFSQYPSYSQEVRVVGHSLGTQMAVYLTYKINSDVMNDVNNIAKPTRLELIDPFILPDNLGDTDLPADSQLSLPYDYLPDGHCDVSNRYNIYCIVENAVYALAFNHGVKITTYGSFISGLLNYNLRYITNYQGLNAGFMCAKSWWGNYAECGSGNLLKNMNVIEAEHALPLLSYMWSISEPNQPSGGKSAAKDTSGINMPKWKTQRADGQYCNIPSGKSLLDVTDVARGFHVTPHIKPPKNKGKLVQYLEDIGWPTEEAEQCAEAISLENDVYDDNGISPISNPLQNMQVPMLEKPEISGSIALNGTTGNDTALDGTSGRDYIRGLGGNDIIRGLNGADEINGNSGNDVVNGNSGPDYVRGGSGSDTVQGGSGHDYVSGDKGHDLIYGNKGNDILEGGNGDDTFYISDGHGTDIVLPDNVGSNAIVCNTSNEVSAKQNGDDLVLYNGYFYFIIMGYYNGTTNITSINCPGF